MRSIFVRLIYVVGAVVLVACVGDAAGDTGAAIERGRQIYHGEVVTGGQIPTCVSCHAVEPGQQPAVLGPNLSNIGNRAATTVPGQSAEEYLRTAILDGDAFLSGGFQEGIHYRGYREVLTDEQVNDLIAYMLTLRSGQDN